MHLRSSKLVEHELALESDLSSGTGISIADVQGWQAVVVIDGN